MAQVFIQKKNYDLSRTQKMAFFGLVFAGPTLHIWYSNILPKLANRIFSYEILKPYSTINKKVVCSVFLDQTVFTSFNLIFFFMFMDYVDSRNIIKSWKNCKKKFTSTIYANWKLWPIAQLINLSFIPIQYRVLYVNLVGVFWNCFLSYSQYKK